MNNLLYDVKTIIIEHVGYTSSIASVNKEFFSICKKSVKYYVELEKVKAKYAEYITKIIVKLLDQKYQFELDIFLEKYGDFLYNYNDFKKKYKPSSSIINIDQKINKIIEKNKNIHLTFELLEVIYETRIDFKKRLDDTTRFIYWRTVIEIINILRRLININSIAYKNYRKSIEFFLEKENEFEK